MDKTQKEEKTQDKTNKEYQNNNYENNYENIENYEYEQGVETNYENYENIPGEIVGETEIRNSIHDAVIRQSLNKPLIQENTLPSQYLPEKLNQEIVENTGTLPLIETEQNIAYSTSQNYNNTASYQSQFYENQMLYLP